MTSQVTIPKEKMALYSTRNTIYNTFNKTIEVCEYHQYVKYFGTGNENFPKGSQSSSDDSFSYYPSKETGKEICFESKPNPYYNEKLDILNTYKFKKQAEEIFETLSHTKNIDEKYLNIYKKCIETYEILGGNHMLIENSKLKLEYHETQNKAINNCKILYEYYKNKELVSSKSFNHLKKIKHTLLKIKNKYDISPELSHHIDKNLNLLKSTGDEYVKNSLKIKRTTLAIAPSKTYNHIPNPYKSEISIKSNQLTSDNSRIIYIIIKHGQMREEIMTECEKIRWMIKFIEQYKKYAEHCLEKNVQLEPIPDIDILRRCLGWVTLSNWNRIYNKYYNPPIIFYNPMSHTPIFYNPILCDLIIYNIILYNKFLH